MRNFTRNPSQVKTICNKPIVNEVLTDSAMLKPYVHQIQKLPKELELAFISKGRSPIRHLGTRPIAVSSAKGGSTVVTVINHVNYRDSKLTRILKNSLEGNSKTALICTVSPTVVEQTKSTLQQLSIMQCNIYGLCSTATKLKLEEIMEIAEKQKIQIIALQETKLNEKYNLKYKNYNILRKDRNKEGGGLAFLIKNLYYEDIAINIPNTSDLKAQGNKVYLNQNKTINIFNMYHPPNNKLIDDGTMAQFLTDNTIIVGDLNAKHQLWGCSTPNPRGKILSNLFDDNAFMCLNDGNPTHHSYSYNTAQALDISLSSPDIFYKCKWQILKSIGSDHLPILIEISTKTKTSSIKEKFWNFKKANWNIYQQNTNEDFKNIPTRIKDLEQNWISFNNTIIKAAKVSIPRGNSYQISSKIKFEIKYKKIEKKARKITHDCKNVTSTHNIFHEKINMKELDYALENTDLNKTPGPDGIHGQMISNLGKNGKEKLLDIFNNSWKTGKLPQDWKTATIIPIKKLDKSADDPKNYRPISLTNICCKLMEKIILRRLTYHLDTSNLLPKEHYGFRKGHGTIDQLLFFTQKFASQVKTICNKPIDSAMLKPYVHQIQKLPKELEFDAIYIKSDLSIAPNFDRKEGAAVYWKVLNKKIIYQITQANNGFQTKHEATGTKNLFGHSGTAYSTLTSANSAKHMRFVDGFS
ncbi:hypothetical protein LAZ67_8002666 [Cordylochernes scorpioides]|uniref:Kinesin motor domain-containing protein n=1 Tax=Cordylochernes scorpioides TaxID=51811 RepID=A0ABY6KUT5_9ARAC|nr:hypothetical protein LAZ67_8002666 [Cordylochernes scorpioides]